MKYKTITSVLLLFVIIQCSISATYQLPFAAYSLNIEDIDLDGDKDIVVGHDIAVMAKNPCNIIPLHGFCQC